MSMSKKLSEMTLKKLWQLFPIFLTEHNPLWKTQYAEEAALLAKVLPESAKLNHIGSTAVNGIMAKPIVDILAELPTVQELKAAAEKLEKIGYTVMSESENAISLNKGYTENGFAEKVFHLHLRLYGNNDEIAFRDYLNAHRETAENYEKLKLELWKKFEHDRNAYTAAKTDFVKRCTAFAKAENEKIH